MSSVNAPACLLACNHFNKNFPPSPAAVKPTFSCRANSARHKPREFAFWVTMATPPGVMGTKGLWISIILGSSTSLQSSPAKRGVK